MIPFYWLPALLVTLLVVTPVGWVAWLLLRRELPGDPSYQFHRQREALRRASRPRVLP